MAKRKGMALVPLGQWSAWSPVNVYSGQLQGAEECSTFLGGLELRITRLNDGTYQPLVLGHAVSRTTKTPCASFGEALDLARGLTRRLLREISQRLEQVVLPALQGNGTAPILVAEVTTDGDGRIDPALL